MDINLLPLDQRRVPNGAIRKEFLLILAALLILVAVAGLSAARHLEMLTLEDEHAAAVQVRTNLEQQRRQVDALEAEVEQIRALTERYRQAVEHETDSLAELLQLTETAHAFLWLEELRFDQQRWELRGYSRDLVAFGDFLFQAGQHGFGLDVRQSQVDSETGLVTFAVSAEREGR